MPLTYTDTDIKSLTINSFETLADYQEAVQNNLIGTGDICFIDENLQADWDQVSTVAPDYIKNKPTLAAVATSGSYNDLSDKLTAGNGVTISTTNVISVAGGGGGGGGATELEQLTDVALNTPADNQVLMYVGSDGKWENMALSTVAINGSYNSLSNRPTIGMGTITIRNSNGETVNFNVNATTNSTVEIPTSTAWKLRHDNNVIFKIGTDSEGWLDGVNYVLCGFNSSDELRPICATNLDINSVSHTSTINPFKGFILAKATPKGGFISGSLAYRQNLVPAVNGKDVLPQTGSPLYLITDMWDGIHDVNLRGVSTTMDTRTDRLSIFLGWWRGGNKESYFELWPQHPIYYHNGTQFMQFDGNTSYGSGGVTTLSSLTDVTLSNNIRAGDILIYNGSGWDSHHAPSEPNNATLTIQRNGSTIGTFTANSSTAKTVNIAVPTVGTLNTNNSSSQTVSSNESLTGTVNLHKVAKTGKYSDLIGTPTIPAAANNGVLTISRNNSVIGTFGANQSTPKTINIEVPTRPNDKVLTIQKNGTTIGTFSADSNTDKTVNIQVSELPTVSASDNGKVLQVVNGVWTVVTPITVYSGSGTPNNSMGNNGDIYIQS